MADHPTFARGRPVGASLSFLTGCLVGGLLVCFSFRFLFLCLLDARDGCGKPELIIVVKFTALDRALRKLVDDQCDGTIAGNIAGGAE